MFGWFIDFLNYMGWMLFASFFYLIDSMYEEIKWFSMNALSLVIDNPIMQSANQYFTDFAYLIFPLLIIIYVILSLVTLNTDKLLKVVKNIFITFLLIIATPVVVESMIDITSDLINDSANVFVYEDTETTQSIGIQMANSFIYKNPDNETDDTTYPPQPFTSMEDIRNKEIINARENKEYVYNYVNPLFSFLIMLVYVCILIFASIKIFLYTSKAVWFQIFAPVIMVLNGAGYSQSAKNWFLQFVKVLLSFYLQNLALFFSFVFMNVTIQFLNDSGHMNFFWLIVVLIGSAIAMIDGPQAFVELFGIDTGVTSVAQSYVTAKAIQSGAHGISKTADAIGSVAGKIDTGSVGDSIKNMTKQGDNQEANEKDNNISPQKDNVNQMNNMQHGSNNVPGESIDDGSISQINKDDNFNTMNNEDGEMNLFSSEEYSSSGNEMDDMVNEQILDSEPFEQVNSTSDIDFGMYTDNVNQNSIKPESGDFNENRDSERY